MHAPLTWHVFCHRAHGLQGLLTPEGRRIISGLVVNVFVPCLFFSKMGAGGFGCLALGAQALMQGVVQPYAYAWAAGCACMCRTSCVRLGFKPMNEWHCDHNRRMKLCQAARMQSLCDVMCPARRHRVVGDSAPVASHSQHGEAG